MPHSTFVTKVREYRNLVLKTYEEALTIPARKTAAALLMKKNTAANIVSSTDLDGVAKVGNYLTSINLAVNALLIARKISARIQATPLPFREILGLMDLFDETIRELDGLIAKFGFTSKQRATLSRERIALDTYIYNLRSKIR